MLLFQGVALNVQRPPSCDFNKVLESKMDPNKSRGLHTVSLQQLFTLQAELLLSPTFVRAYKANNEQVGQENQPHSNH